MALDITVILEKHKKSGGQSQSIAKRIIDQAQFINEKDTLGIIGLGGTISSGYSFDNETIVPLSSKPADIVLTMLKNTFGILTLPHTALDLFAKDSRHITNEDICDLLEFILACKNELLMITCGTYMLASIAEIIAQSGVGQNKIIGLTASMLPLGFSASDATANIVGTLSAINAVKKTWDKQTPMTLVCFHGEVYSTIEDFRSIKPHTENTKNRIISLPQTVIPVINSV